MSRPPTPQLSYSSLVGQVLQRCRENKGLYQSDLAIALGISQSAYSRLEKGESALSVAQLKIASVRLGMSSSAILQQAENWLVQLQRQGVQVTDDKPDNTAALLIALGILAAIIAASK